MKKSHGIRITLLLLLCACFIGLGYMGFKIFTSAQQTEPSAQPEDAQSFETYLVKEEPWPPFSNQRRIALPLISTNRVTLYHPRENTNVKLLHQPGDTVKAGETVAELENQQEKHKLREAEKRYALLQATHDHASAIYAVTGSNAQVLDALRERLIQAETELIQARQKYAERALIAPIDGIIDYHISDGATPQPQQPLLTIHAVRTLGVEIPEDYFSREQLDQRPEKNIAVHLPDYDNKISPASFTLSPTGKLILHIPNPDGHYRIGATAEIPVEALPRTREIVAPLHALRKIDDIY
ncbi:MAG: hypothetical protein NZM04_00530, partial [Methylacidiphilales bacterium]|nr:hypothetical protein [Candidatus Methylacidiphilales bacterium]